MNKSGFGLLEVLVSAVVLGFLIVGLFQLQNGNREAVVRIRSRDAAQIIAQDFLDSLSSLGISSIVGNVTADSIQKEKDYEWKGQNGSITAKINYTIEATIKDSTVTEKSSLENFERIVSKNINLKVSWLFKNSKQSISMSRIIK